MTAPVFIKLNHNFEPPGVTIDYKPFDGATEFVPHDLAQSAVAAAIEAAAQVVLGSNLGLDISDIADDVRALATPDQIAALAAERAATVTVKPLVWEDIAPHHSKAALPLFGSIRAESWGGDYSVVWSVHGMCDTFTHGKWATLDAAKAAAQADYDARIRSALIVTNGVTPDTLAKSDDFVSLPRAEAEDVADTLNLVADWMEKSVKDRRIIGPEFHVPTLRKALAALQAERKAGWRRPVIPSDWATDTMKVAMKMLTIEVAKGWLFRDSMDLVEEDFARELGVIFSNGKGYHGISDIRGDERDDAHAILIDRALRGAIAALTLPTEAKP